MILKEFVQGSAGEGVQEGFHPPLLYQPHANHVEFKMDETYSLVVSSIEGVGVNTHTGVETVQTTVPPRPGSISQEVALCMDYLTNLHL